MDRESADNDGGPPSYIGDGPIADVAMVAMNIDATFGSSRHFTDEEARQLLVGRVVPNSVRPYDDAAAELLESVDDLWTLVDESYQEAWGRAANEAERRFFVEYAFAIIRGNDRSESR